MFPSVYFAPVYFAPVYFGTATATAAAAIRVLFGALTLAHLADPELRHAGLVGDTLES